jgi:hypothetical protein
MKLKLDPTLFDEQQFGLVRELVQSIRVKLQEIGLSGEKLDQATASIAFSVASTIDDTSAIEADGKEIHPYLTFRTTEEQIIHCGENSYTHEFVYEVLQSLYEQGAR